MEAVVRLVVRIEHDVSETGSVSVFRWKAMEAPIQLGPIKKVWSEWPLVRWKGVGGGKGICLAGYVRNGKAQPLGPANTNASTAHDPEPAPSTSYPRNLTL
jgi:hypothetical protein